jgi:hypothetical protein
MVRGSAGAGLEADEPTILLTNDAKSTAKKLIAHYAKRMLIENALADAVRFFHIDALSSCDLLATDGIGVRATPEVGSIGEVTHMRRPGMPPVPEHHARRCDLGLDTSQAR